MFEKLNELVASVQEPQDGIVGSYRSVINARKILQQVKNEAQRLRLKLTNDFKASKTKE